MHLSQVCHTHSDFGSNLRDAGSCRGLSVNVRSFWKLCSWVQHSATIAILLHYMHATAHEKVKIHIAWTGQPL